MFGASSSVGSRYLVALRRQRKTSGVRFASADEEDVAAAAAEVRRRKSMYPALVVEDEEGSELQNQQEEHETWTVRAYYMYVLLPLTMFAWVDLRRGSGTCPQDVWLSNTRRPADVHTGSRRLLLIWSG